MLHWKHKARRPENTKSTSGWAAEAFQMVCILLLTFF
jgi:hypothetical protein